MAKKILIVDDVVGNRKILSFALKDIYDITEAANGKEAMDIIEENSTLLSAVLLDIQMPVMDGYEVLRLMRDNPQFAQIPVIVVTGIDDGSSRVKALSLGANDFVTKPYNIEIIKYCLSNSIALCERAAIANSVRLDRLTGVYNREFFFKVSDELIKSHEPNTYIMASFDIDNFKLVNDRYGAAEGDRILKHIGSSIKAAFDIVGGVCGRISGDNFSALIPNNPQAIGFIDGKHEQAELLPGDTPATLNFSVGRYIVSDVSLPASALYDRAYIAKQSVKGRYDSHIAYFDDSMLAAMMQEQEIVNDTAAAIAEKQFEIWFQPQYNHSNGALIGAEALVRWRHPTKGFIPPGLFVPVFEQNGFIYEMDRYVWEEVCRYLRKWIDNGNDPLPVSVNISRYDIFKPDMPEVLLWLINKYDIPIELLRLEITESAFSKSGDQIIKVIRQLIEIGFTVEIDDFGSGYSSLNTLKDVPVQILKLDMRFFEDSGDSQRGGSILESVVRMSSWLGVSVIAEGVETREQADYLESIGCILVQGYYYARPMTASSYEAVALDLGKEINKKALATIAAMSADEFWNPTSLDTLIFSSFIGGACVMELFNGKCEIVRVNTRYIEAIRSNQTTDGVLSCDPLETLSPEDREHFIEQVETSAITGEEFRGEFWKVLVRDTPVHSEYVRYIGRVIAQTNTRKVVYLLVENLTAQKKAEEQIEIVSRQMYAIMENINGGVLAVTSVNGKIDYIFANDQYYSLFGYTKEQFALEVPGGIVDLIFKEDIDSVLAAIDEVVRTGKPMRFEYRTRSRDGKVLWMRTNSSACTMEGIDSTVVLSVIVDITFRKETENQLRFLNEISHVVLSQTNAETAIDEVLNKLLAYFGGKRAYICEYDSSKQVLNNTYEICAPGVSSSTQLLGNITIDRVHRWLDFLGEKKLVRINVNSLKKNMDSEKVLFKERGIENIVLSLICRDGKNYGLIGIDEPSDFQQTYYDNLETLSDYVLMLLTRRDYEAKIQTNKKLSEQLVQDMPGGYAKMRIFSDGSVAPVFLNDEFCRMFGLTREQAFELYEHDAYGGVHPDDLERVMAIIGKCIEDRTTLSLRVRLVCGDGSYTTVQAFYRVTEDSDAVRWLNGYYNDPTEHDRLEQQRAELLDNLPNVAGLYEYDGKSLHVLHVNKSYREALGRSFENIVADSYKSVIHPDDIGTMRREIDSAIGLNRDAVCDLRILHGTGNYEPYHFTAKIKKQADAKHLIYANYIPISQEVMSYQSMLPILLAAIMESSTDYAFAKDKELRYITASRAFSTMSGLKDKNDLVGKTDYEIYSKKFADKYRRDDETIFATNEPLLDMVEAIPTVDGVERYSSTSKFPLRDTYGNVIGIYGIGRDVTVKRDVSESPRLPNESVPTGIALLEFGPDASRTISFNDDYYLFSGYTGEEFKELVADNPLATVFDEDLHEISATIDYIKANPKSVANCAYRCHTRNGGYHWFAAEATVAEIRGDIIALNVVQRDVTEQKESEMHFRQLTDNIPGGIATYDCSYDSVKITYFNDGFCQLFKVNRSEYEKLCSINAFSKVFAEDLPRLMAQVEATIEKGSAIDCIYRARVGDGYKWISHKALPVAKYGDTVTVNAMLVDVTEQYTAIEKLRVSEEENRLAVKHSGNIICRFNIAERTLKIVSDNAKQFSISEQLSNVPYAQVWGGDVSADSQNAYVDFYEKIINGAADVKASFQFRTHIGWRWQNAYSSTVFDDMGEPLFAIISFFDVTEQIEKEAIVRKWQQSLADREPGSYELYRCNISRDASFDTKEGSLLFYNFDNNELSFNERSKNYAKSCIHPDERKAYVELVNSDLLLASYYRGKRNSEIEYREILEDETRWIKLTIEMVELPGSTDVAAYLLYENIDSSKREELETKESAETDPLTGILNRKVFIEKTEQLLHNGSNSMLALFMFDVDDFKVINDNFGHAVGDAVLTEFAKKLHDAVRTGDLVCRLGGDEFIICLNNLPNKQVIVQKAKQFCNLLRREIGDGISLTASLGIAISPNDGLGFEELYKKADSALYYAKEKGKNSFAFYSPGLPPRKEINPQ